jgi:hypothetical protein
MAHTDTHINKTQERNRKVSADVSALKRTVEEAGAAAGAARTDAEGAREGAHPTDF